MKTLLRSGSAIGPIPSHGGTCRGDSYSLPIIEYGLIGPSELVMVKERTAMRASLA
jgi:hypothetical protein